MNKYSSRIWKLKKELVDIEKRLNELQSEKRRKLRVLSRANSDYELNRISHDEYSKVWSNQLNNHSIEDLFSGYDSWINNLENRRESIESEINEIRRTEELSNKALSLSLSLLLVFGLITGLGLFGTEIIELTGFATSQTTGTTGEAEINAYYAIQLSNNSIKFGTLLHGSINNSAILNKESVGPTEYYVNVSEDSNVDVHINISADGHLTNGSNIIGVGNLTWSCSNFSNANIPNIGNETELSTNEVLTTTDSSLEPGENSYYRFWIDIPLGTQSGQYSNNVTFISYRAS